MILVFNKDKELIDIKTTQRMVANEYGFHYQGLRNKKWVNNSKVYKGYTLVRVYPNVFSGYSGPTVRL